METEKKVLSDDLVEQYEKLSAAYEERLSLVDERIEAVCVSTLREILNAHELVRTLPKSKERPTILYALENAEMFITQSGVVKGETLQEAE